MVKLLLVFLLSFSFIHADEIDTDTQDLLILKIKSLVDEKVFIKDRAYLDILFTPKAKYYHADGRVNSVKVIKTLKDNGVLNLFFKKPREISMTFKTNGESLFFVKIMSDTLRNIGYYRYVTRESTLTNSEFTWKISLTTEYATDPVVLEKELKKSGCEITDVIKDAKFEWTYLIDMTNARLNTRVLHKDEILKLKRSLYSYWLDVSEVQSLRIDSSRRNSWYPYIAYYDKSLKLLRVIRRDKKRSTITLNMKENTHYLKISDIYTLKNIKDSLVLTPIGSRKIKD